MLKQVLKVLIVSLMMLAVASPAWAGAINVILDDPTLGGGPLAYFLPFNSSNPYNMVWQTCSGANSPVPSYEPASGYQDCLAIVNNTGFAITNLELTLTVPSGFDSAPCLVSDSTTGFGCTSTIAGGILTLDFVGLPGFINNTEIYIGVGLPGEDVTGIGNPSASVPTYDPSTLVLVLTGMAVLGICGVRRYA